eukprot:6443294-Pyramimonas_sp.AAC.1
MHIRERPHPQEYFAVHPGLAEAATVESVTLSSSRSIASWPPPFCGDHHVQDSLFAQDSQPRHLPLGEQGDQGHRRRLMLLDAISRWAEQWVPSLYVSLSGSDFQQWMEWCVPYAADVSRYTDFRPLFSFPSSGAGGAMTCTSERWNMAIELCMSGCYSSATPREQACLHLGQPWPVNDYWRVRTLRQRALAHLRQRDWTADVSCMSEAERADLLRLRHVFPSGPPLSLNPLPLLLPHLAHVEGDCDVRADPYLPDEDNRSVDNV